MSAYPFLTRAQRGAGIRSISGAAAEGMLRPIPAAYSVDRELRLKLIVEFDGPIADVLPVYYLVYKRAAGAVGWAAVDEPTFRRALRRQGRQAAILPGARPAKVAELWKSFDRWIEGEEAIEAASVQQDAASALPALVKEAPVTVVTLGSNLIARRRMLERAELTRFVSRMEALSDDPRQRVAELRALAQNDPRTVVVASTDVLVRAAAEAECLTIGLACGTCLENRLHQAGVSLVMSGLTELADSLRRGAPELVSAGMLPPSNA